MNVTLFVEDNEHLRKAYQINLRTYVGIEELVFASSAEDAIDKIRFNNKISLIICKSNIKNKNTVGKLFQFLTEEELKIQMISIGKSSVPSHDILQLASALNIQQIIKYSAKFLNVTAQDMARLSVPEFFSFNIQYFYEITHSNVDIFKKEGEDFIKVLSVGEEYVSSAIDVLIKEGHNNLFVHKLDRLKFVDNFTQEFISKIDDHEFGYMDQLKATEMNRELLARKIRHLGITPETQALAKKNMKQVMSQVRKSPTLNKLLAQLMKNKSSFLFKHTQILSYVGLHILDNIDWGSKEQKEKFGFMAFFHDICLTTDAQARIHSKDDLKVSRLTDKEKTLVERHAMMAAELVSRFPRSPIGVDQIIRQHHGMLNGVGFSDHFSAELSPMTIVFVLAEEFTLKICDMGEQNVDVPEMITQMRSRFTTTRFKKIINIIETISI